MTMNKAFCKFSWIVWARSSAFRKGKCISAELITIISK
jgi:hypothetical protein